MTRDTGRADYHARQAALLAERTKPETPALPPEKPVQPVSEGE